MRFTSEAEHISGKCEDCGDPCTSVTRDFGIGGYEYCGQMGDDIQLVECSPCCEAEVVDIEEEEE